MHKYNNITPANINLVLYAIFSLPLDDLLKEIEKIEVQDDEMNIKLNPDAKYFG